MAIKAGRSKSARAPLITTRDIYAFIYMVPLRGLARMLPPLVFVRLARATSNVYMWLRPGFIDYLARTVRRVCGSQVKEDAASIARSFFIKDIRKGFDDLIIPRLDNDVLRPRAHISGLEHLDAGLERGKGIILISPHFHCNRLAKYYLRRNGYPIMSIRNRAATREYAPGLIGRRYLGPAYVAFLDSVVEDEVTIQDRDLSTSILRRLRENGIVDFHIDAAPNNTDHWVEIPCLGHPRFCTGFLKFTELTGASLITMCCIGDTDGFTVNFGKPVAYSRSDSTDEFYARLKPIAAELEATVFAAPAEWELWKTRLLWQQDDTANR